MKAVVGVGFMKQCEVGLDLFVRLGFPGSEAILVHAVESVLPDGGFLPVTSTSPIAEIQMQRKEDGERRMAEIASGLQSRGVPSKSVTVYGNPAHQVTEVAEAEGADLIIAGSGKKGGLESFIMGSVTRALVVDAKRSILIAKQTLPEGAKVDAVFATDHSPYADRCAELLVRLAPRGLGTLTVVTADTTDQRVREALDEDAPEGITREKSLERKNEALCRTLAKICEKAESVVLVGHANQAINATMARTGAGLLILGAHGHGFLERLVIGSTAMHMVGNEPWNVLVLRA